MSQNYVINEIWKEIFYNWTRPFLPAAIHVHCLSITSTVSTRTFQMWDRHFRIILIVLNGSLGRMLGFSLDIAFAFESLINVIMYKTYHLCWGWFINQSFFFFFIILPANILSSLPNNPQNLLYIYVLYSLFYWFSSNLPAILYCLLVGEYVAFVLPSTLIPF